jgi:membrane-bound ClpP family serine protease
MKIAGFLLLAAGWVIVTATLFLLNASGPRAAFALAGIALQVLGLILAVRAHRVMESERD